MPVFSGNAVILGVAIIGGPVAHSSGGPGGRARHEGLALILDGPGAQFFLRDLPERLGQLRHYDISIQRG